MPDRNDTPTPAELTRVCAFVSGGTEAASGPYGAMNALSTDIRGDRLRDGKANIRQRHFGLALAGFIDALSEMEPSDALSLMSGIMADHRPRHYVKRAVPADHMPPNSIAEVVTGGSPGHLVFRWYNHMWDRAGYISEGGTARCPGDPQPAGFGEWPTFAAWSTTPSNVGVVHLIASDLTDDEMRAIFAQPSNALRANLAEHFAKEQKFARDLAMRGAR